MSFGTYARCMFNSITACSREYYNFTNIICKNHSRDILGLIPESVKVFNGIKPETKNIITTDTANTCNQEVELLPFPITFLTANENGPYIHANNKLCIDTNQISNCVSTFIASKNLNSKGYNNRQIQDVIQTLIIYISDGSFNVSINNLNNNNGMMNYNMFSAQNAARLTANWLNPHTMISVVKVDRSIIEFPIAKLPLFYQAILFGFEFAEHTYNDGKPRLNLHPNCICNSNKKYIMIFNQSVDLPLYTNRPGAQYASPLVIAGTVSHDAMHPYSPFERSQVYTSNITNAVNKPPHCDHAETIISSPSPSAPPL
ncbi:31K virion structural protein [Aratus pisonii nudivirus]|nr:31K virion structural protein [Aratus pisonii nudivirus]